VTTTLRTDDDSTWATDTAANRLPVARPSHYPAAATERVATDADIAGHASASDATAHIPVMVEPSEDDVREPRRRVSAWYDIPAQPQAADGPGVARPFATAAPSFPAGPPPAPRRAGTVTTRVTALIAAAAFVLGAAAAVLVGAIAGPGGPPTGAGAVPPGISAPQAGSGSSTSGTGSST
jgi:hypothetical protein